ncbi:MAG: Spy/CpxP family protein refolding chaperone [Proteobacteria bacterium]|nr:Spy/CpxP family protein refolding chaperone [Pseudomonadota bacterium]
MPYRHIEGRLAFLKTELKITAAQEPQWSKFADAVRATSKSASDVMRPMMMGGPMHGQSPTAIDVMNRYEKSLTVRLEAVRAVKAAFEPLYAVLSDEQKKTANELLGSPMGIM